MNDIKVNADALERAHSCALQLRALLAHCIGEGGEAFRNLNIEMQDSYLWLASDVAHEIENALGGARTLAEVEETDADQQAQHGPVDDCSSLVSIKFDADGRLNTKVNIRREDVDSVTDALCLALLKARQAQAKQG
jgi:nitrogen-specific signal transduction histidine kinase